MIEFNGTLTESTKKFYYKAVVRMAQMIYAVTAIPALIITYLFCCIGFGTVIALHLKGILMMFINFFVFFELMNLARFSKKGLTKKIVINNRLITLTKNNNKTEAIKISEIKQVRDYGDCYLLIRSLRGLTTASATLVFICQKDLLTKGTLDGFESLFQNKIKRCNYDRI